MSQARAKKIKLLLFDVDGVLTDGKLFFLPLPVNAPPAAQQAREKTGRGGFGVTSSSMAEAKGFHAHDGTAISLARLGGIRTGLITKRISETVAARASDLRLDHVQQGIEDKLATFRMILEQEGIEAEEAAYVGDDIIDLPVMRHCGLAVSVPNAREEVKSEAHYVTQRQGGEGALRDTVEYILKAQGKFEKVVDEYIKARCAAQR